MASNAELAKNWIGYATEDPDESGEEFQDGLKLCASVAQAHATLAVADAIEELTRQLTALRPL